MLMCGTKLWCGGLVTYQTFIPFNKHMKIIKTGTCWCGVLLFIWLCIKNQANRNLKPKFKKTIFFTSWIHGFFLVNCFGIGTI